MQTKNTKRVGIIGTVGVPANYGGFETLVEQLITNREADNIDYTVYCSAKTYPDKAPEYKGTKLEYIPLDANGAQSIVYDLISMMKSIPKSDCVLILGVSGCAFLPFVRLFTKKRLVINIDGLEHRREKWNKYIKRFLKFSEKMAVRYADVIVTDNKGITDYVQEEYGKPSELIAYGGDHVLRGLNNQDIDNILDKYGLKSKGYDLAICRIEPENNVHTILTAYEGTGKKLVFIGNWDKSEYGHRLKQKYAGSENIIIHDAVYDLDDLHALRAGCRIYLHGHSAGGTNPSLVEAMHFGMPIIAYDCIYNRETTEGKALYFTDSDHLRKLITSGVELSDLGAKMAEVAQRRYTWKIIASEYERLF